MRTHGRRLVFAATTSADGGASDAAAPDAFLSTILEAYDAAYASAKLAASTEAEDATTYPAQPAATTSLDVEDAPSGSATRPPAMGLERTTPSAHEASDERAAATDAAAERQLPTVHVLDVPSALHSDLRTCYQQMYGAVPWDDSQPHGKCEQNSNGTVSTVWCGAHLATEMAQYAADEWLHAAMVQRAAEQPVSADEADVVWVPYYHGLSMFLSTNAFNSLGFEMTRDRCTNSSLFERLTLLAQTLDASPMFHTRKRHFALALSHWNLASVIGRAELSAFHPIVTGMLNTMLGQAQTHLLITDPLFADMGVGYRVVDSNRRMYDRCDATVMPYVPSMALHSAATVDDDNFWNAPRPTLLYFRGNTDLFRCQRITPFESMTVVVRPAYCLLRERLIEAALNNTDTHDLDLNGIRANAQSTPTRYDTSADGALRSLFCLAPRGDTPSSRRVYDAIMAGCIPVIVADDILLAFSRQLDWSRFSLRVPESAALTVVPMLRALSPQRLQAMRHELRRVRPYFAFGSGTPFSPGFVPGVATNLALNAMAAAATSPECATEPRPEARQTGVISQIGELVVSVLPDELTLVNASVLPVTVTTDATSGLTGKRVRLVSFARTAQQFNGEVGVVLGTLPQSEKHVVRLDSDGRLVLVRPDNLMLLETQNERSSVFIIFSAERSASTFLCDSLDLQPDITVDYELLNPYQNAANRSALGYPSYHSVMADLPGFMNRYALLCPTRMCGFKVFDDHVHAPAVLEQLFEWSTRAKPTQTKIIVLERTNRTDQYHSIERALQTGDWGYTPCRQNASSPDFHPPLQTLPNFADFVRETDHWFARARAFSPAFGPLLNLTYTEVTGTDETKLAAMERTLRFLEVEAQPPLVAADC